MEGFLNIRLRPWLRRLITRWIAIIPSRSSRSCTRQREPPAADPDPGDPQPPALLRSFRWCGSPPIASDGDALNPRWLTLSRTSPRDHRGAHAGCFSNPQRWIFCMYRRILVPLEHTDTDRTILAHIRALARVRLVARADPRFRWLGGAHASRFELRYSERSLVTANTSSSLPRLETGVRGRGQCWPGSIRRRDRRRRRAKQCDLIAISPHAQTVLRISSRQRRPLAFGTIRSCRFFSFARPPSRLHERNASEQSAPAR